MPAFYYYLLRNNEIMKNENTRLLRALAWTARQVLRDEFNKADGVLDSNTWDKDHAELEEQFLTIHRSWRRILNLTDKDLNDFLKNPARLDSWTVSYEGIIEKLAAKGLNCVYLPRVARIIETFKRLGGLKKQERIEVVERLLNDFDTFEGFEDFAAKRMGSKQNQVELKKEREELKRKEKAAERAAKRANSVKERYEKKEGELSVKSFCCGVMALIRDFMIERGITEYKQATCELGQARKNAVSSLMVYIKTQEASKVVNFKKRVGEGLYSKQFERWPELKGRIEELQGRFIG